MIRHDAVADSETQSHPLADIFRGEEWVEDVWANVGRDAGAGVRDDDLE